jgi:hypothetical protein
MSRRARSARGLFATLVAMLMATGIFVLASPVAAQDVESVTVEHKPDDDSGVTGTAVLTADGDQTEVTVDLEGAEEGYEGHMFDSTCDDHQSATVFHAIEPVDADGHSESVVEAPLLDLTSGDFWVHIHRPAGERGVGVACGQVEQAVGGELPATGVGVTDGRGLNAWLLAGLAAAVAAFGASWVVRREGVARG